MKYFPEDSLLYHRVLKIRVLDELKALPSFPGFPGGSDFLALVARFTT